VHSPSYFLCRRPPTVQGSPQSSVWLWRLSKTTPECRRGIPPPCSQSVDVAGNFSVFGSPIESCAVWYFFFSSLLLPIKACKWLSSARRDRLAEGSFAVETCGCASLSESRGFPIPPFLRQDTHFFPMPPVSSPPKGFIVGCMLAGDTLATQAYGAANYLLVGDIARAGDMELQMRPVVVSFSI